MRLVLLLLFVLPVGYGGVLLAVTVHEVLGHGLAAVLLGGSFDGFEIHWDAMGYAQTTLPPDVTTSGRVFHLAAGALVTTALGALLLWSTRLARRGGLIYLAPCLLSCIFVLDGSEYMFWSAYGMTGNGDFARIVRLTDSDAWRWGFMVSGALLTVFFLWWPMSLFTRGANLWLWGRQPAGGWRRLLIPLGVALGLVLGMASFDWEQLVPGIGSAPTVVAVILGILTGLILWSAAGRPDEEVERLSMRDAAPHLLTTWGAFGLLLWLVAASMRTGMIF